jgi:hypothetical protein
VTAVTFRIRRRELNEYKPAVEWTMQTVLAIRSFCQRSWPIFAAGNDVAVPDRALKALIREHAMQIDAARRHWACPF